MADAWQVPTVDIGPYVEGGTAGARDAVASAIDAANRSIGFVQVVGHGVADDVIAGLEHAIDAFFGLPLEEKSYLFAHSGVNRGYSPARSESLSLSLGVAPPDGAKDLFEAFNIGTASSDFPGVELPSESYPENLWPEGIAGFKDAVTAYFARAGRVARTMTRIFADALGLEAGFFDTFTDHSVDVLRMNHYALPEGTGDTGGLRGMGEHTDYGIVTVLWADPVPGLEVLGTDRVWHAVLPESGALLINLGDLTARWTNEQWLSTLHRVMPPVVDGRIARRRSAAYFHDGNIDAVIGPIPSCVSPDHPALYPPTTVADHLAAKLGGSRSGHANPGADREADRVRAAAAPTRDVP